MKRHVQLLEEFEKRLDARQSRSARRALTILPPNSIDFSSNDFLSLATSEQLKDEYRSELGRRSHLPLGSGGSRLLDGNSAYAEQIERDIASFHGAPSGLLFNSGFDANSGLFSCVPQSHDAIVHDEYIHASVHEGMRLSRARLRRSFKHNSIRGFRKVLDDVVAVKPLLADGIGNVFVAVETVYSMDGDVAPLKELLSTLNERLPEGNGHLVVDEAHSTGVYGLNGRGLVCDLGIEDQVLVRLHTFGKALSSGGAIILCAPIMREYLINYARSLIYTTAMGLPTLAMIKTVYRLMTDGGTSQAQEDLWQLMQYLHIKLRSLAENEALSYSQAEPASPIFSLHTQRPRELAKYCQERELVVRPIVPPTVPNGSQRVRICIHAANTTQEIDRLIHVCHEWAQRSNAKDDSDASRVRSRL